MGTRICSATEKSITSENTMPTPSQLSGVHAAAPHMRCHHPRRRRMKRRTRDAGDDDSDAGDDDEEEEEEDDLGEGAGDGEADEGGSTSPVGEAMVVSAGVGGSGVAAANASD